MALFLRASKCMIAIDTNVLVYAFDGSDKRRGSIAQAIVQDTPDGVLLWQVACEFTSVMIKKLRSHHTPEQAWIHLAVLIDWMPLHYPTEAVFIRARALMAERQIHFWDAMIYAACLESGVRRLYSEDLPGGIIPDLEIINPFA